MRSPSFFSAGFAMSIASSSQWVLDKDQQAALGCAVVEASYLERYIETLILRFCDLPVTLHDALVHERLTIGPKISILTDLVLPLLTKEADKKRFSKIMDTIGQSNTDRTVAVHGIWGKGSANYLHDLLYGMAPPKAVKGRAGGKKHELSVEKLLKLATEINDANWDLHEFIDDHFLGLVQLQPISEKQHLSRIQKRLRALAKKRGHPFQRLGRPR